LVVFFHGSITPERLPLSVLHALALCPLTIGLRFAGYETDYNGYAQRILSEADGLNISDRVHFLGALPGRGELLTECARAHVGLSLMPMKSDDLNMLAMVGASNKPFDYLLCGLALLVSDLPDWNATYVTPGFGLACNPEDASSIARALHWFFENRIESSEMATKGRTRVLTTWNYEAQFKSVLERMGSTGRPAATRPA
jgi:glycosyltransferase involved in cell wall biosynthesis